MEKWKYRQVERLYISATDPKSLYSAKEARDQLNGALIIHYKHAWHYIKHYAKSLVMGKCPCCGYRHFRKNFKLIEDRGSVYCGYGWLDSLKSWPFMVYMASKHGED